MTILGRGRPFGLRPAPIALQFMNTSIEGETRGIGGANSAEYCGNIAEPEQHPLKVMAMFRSENLKWCGVSVIIDNDTSELFEMSKPDDDPEQKPAFLVTQSTANLVGQDFERYEPSLERMAEDWQEDKNLFPLRRKR